MGVSGKPRNNVNQVRQSLASPFVNSLGPVLPTTLHNGILHYLQNASFRISVLILRFFSLERTDLCRVDHPETVQRNRRLAGKGGTVSKFTRSMVDTFSTVPYP